MNLDDDGEVARDFGLKSLVNRNDVIWENAKSYINFNSLQGSFSSTFDDV